MILSEYIAKLQKIIMENPEAGNYTVVYSQDDEGNYFYNVHFSPSLGYFDGDECFSSEADLEDINSICIN